MTNARGCIACTNFPLGPKKPMPFVQLMNLQVKLVS